MRETQIKETQGIIMLWNCWTFFGKIRRGKDIPLIPRIIKITVPGHTVKEHLVAKCGSDEEKVFKGKRKYHGPNISNLKKTFGDGEIVAGRWPLPGPASGLLSNTRKLIDWGDTRADKARNLLGRGTRVESSRAREPRRTALPGGSVSGFMARGLVSRLSLSDRSDSGHFLVVHALLSQGGCQWGFWELVGHVVSPFDLS